jgi:hypothetical protein
MANDTQFIQGLIVKAPHERAPEYVKAKLSIKREELIAWLQQQSGEWINADVKVSRGGKWYCAVDEWKRDGGERKPQRSTPSSSAPADEFEDSIIPF